MGLARDIRTNIEYRILKWISPEEPTHMSGAAYAGKSKIRVLLGDELFAALRGRAVLDFGCGRGEDAVAIAGIARSVYGLDIVPRYLEEARRLADAAGVGHTCTFASVPPQTLCEVIVSLDSFEHFAEPSAVLQTMYELLPPGGQVFTSFGPTWYHPYGGHLFSIFPWAHLVFSETALIRWRADIRSDGATRFAEVEGGLNQMTIARFEREVARSPFEIVRLEPVPIRRLRMVHTRVTREFTSAVVRCVLRKPSA